MNSLWVSKFLDSKMIFSGSRTIYHDWSRFQRRRCKAHRVSYFSVRSNTGMLPFIRSRVSLKWIVLSQVRITKLIIILTCWIYLIIIQTCAEGNALINFCQLMFILLRSFNCLLSSIFKDWYICNIGIMSISIVLLVFVSIHFSDFLGLIKMILHYFILLQLKLF